MIPNISRGERIEVANVMSDALVYLTKRFEENPTPELGKIIEKFDAYIKYAHGDFS
jgi:hypothetical protein